MKVLLVGPVKGNIDTLLKRVQTANAKAGPFAAVLAVGQFFEHGDAGAVCPSWFSSCLDGQTKLSIPLFFSSGDGVTQLAAHLWCSHLAHLAVSLSNMMPAPRIVLIIHKRDAASAWRRRI